METCEFMCLDAKGILGGLTIMWNPLEVIFHDWVASPCILTRHFHYLRSKHKVIPMTVYGPPMVGGKLIFMKDINFHWSVITDSLRILKGNFKLITNLNENKGGICKLDSE